MDALDGVDEVESARALGVLESARHRDRQTRLSLMHFRGRRPRWPSGNAADALGPRPREAVAAHGDRILVGSFARQHIVKLAALRIDENRAHVLVPVEVDDRRLGGVFLWPAPP